MEGKKDRISTGIVIITYLVGTLGFAIEQTKPLFLLMSPFHLLLVFFLLILSHPGHSYRFWEFLVFTFVISYAAEWIGVHTSLLFGNYWYGMGLGFKLGEVPVIIGINWAMLVYCAYSVSSYLLKEGPGAVIFSALILVIVDYIMEPAAVKLGFWYWAGNAIPLYNYICWFLLSLILGFAAWRSGAKGKLLLPLTVLICQAVFFIVLQLMPGMNLVFN